MQQNLGIGQQCREPRIVVLGAGCDVEIRHSPVRSAGPPDAARHRNGRSLSLYGCGKIGHQAARKIMSDAPPQIPAPRRKPIATSLAYMGLLGAHDRISARPLEGGVSSEIWLVDLPGRRLCLKRALPQLRVEQLWEAPTTRNHHEYAWFRIAGRICPEAVPRLIGQDSAHGLFAMEYLDPAMYPVWKDQLRDGNVDPATAAAVGDPAGADPRRDRRRRARSPACSRPTTAFYALRIEPYLVAPTRLHPDLAGAAGAAGACHGAHPPRAGARRRQPEEHPDRPARPGVPRRRMRLVRRPGLRPRLLPQSSAAEMPVEPPARSAAILACFDALARDLSRRGRPGSRARTSRSARRTCCRRCCWRAIDGKSPVEYVTAEADKDRVRRVARALLLEPVDRLDAVREAWAAGAGRRVSDTAHRRACAAGGSGIRAAARPSRPKCAWPAARSGGRSRRPAPRPARARRSTCATAARGSAASTCAARSPRSTARSPRR